MKLTCPYCHKDYDDVTDLLRHENKEHQPELIKLRNKYIKRMRNR